MSRLSRRGFLLSLLALTAASGGGLALYNARRQPRDPTLLIAERVRRRLAHLELETEDLAHFGADFWKRCDPGKRLRIERLADGPNDLAARKLEREIVSSFLRGSDFFHQSTEPVAVSYVAFPDPYEIGCANPLARQADAREQAGRDGE